MNDSGYITITYKGSYLFNSLTYDYSQLKRQKQYTVGAIEFHKREDNPKQEAFFKEHLIEIEKRISKAYDEAFESWAEKQSGNQFKTNKQSLRVVFDAMDDEDKF